MYMVSLVAQLVKNLPATRETWVCFLVWEDPLEKGKATYSGILAWRIPWTVAYQDPPSMRFSRQEYWSGLPFPSPGDPPDPGIKPRFPHCRQTLYHLSHQGSPSQKEKGKYCILIQLCATP